MKNYTFSQKVLLVITITLLITVIVLLIFNAAEVFLLIFAGILLAVFLRGLAKLLKKIIPVSINISLIIVLILLLTITIGGSALLGPSLADGLKDLSNRIPDALNELEKTISAFPLGKEFINNISSSYKEFISDSDVLSRITGVFSTTLGALVNILVILVVGLYTAFDPGLYRNGVIKLVPPKKRDRANEVLDALSNALSWWLVGTFASMFVVGVLTIIGLLILGIPLAFTLGILAALLTFIPNLGPFVSAIPPVLIGLIESPQKAFYVIILYSGIQLVESYLITPLIQKRAVSMPPALLISSQILMGVILGIFGLLLATPLLVVIIVLVQMLYVNDTLGDDVEVLGDNHS